MSTSVKVAQIAGVSQSTVSRVINGDPRISPQTVAKVRAAMVEADYTPPAASTDGRRKRSRSRAGIYHGRIAVLFPDTRAESMRTELSSRALVGIEQEAREQDLSVMVTTLPGEKTLPGVIDPRQIDGVIVRGYEPWLDEALRGIPTCWMYELPQRPSHGDNVAPDNATCGQFAFDYLHHERGRHKLAVVQTQANQPAFMRRASSFCDQAQLSGLTVHRVSPAHQHADKQKQIAGEVKMYYDLLSSSDRPDGLYITGPEIEIAYRVAHSLGIDLNKDLDIIATSHSPRAVDALVPVPANIDIAPEAIGQASVQTLLWRQANPGQPGRTITTHPVLNPAQDYCPISVALSQLELSV